MTQLKIVAWFLRKDYALFKRLSPEDSSLPDTFEEWLEFAEKQVAQYEANGMIIRKIAIRPHRFAGYCDSRGLNRNRVARDAFALRVSRDTDLG